MKNRAILTGCLLLMVVSGAASAASRESEEHPSEEKGGRSHRRRGELTLAWNPVPGAAWYNLYYDTRPGVGPKRHLKVIRKIRSTRRTVSGLSMVTTYYFAVTAGNRHTESPPSSEVSGMPKPGKKYKSGD